MNEREWLTCSDPEAMLLALSELKASTRRLRLFGCACCRRIWKLSDAPWFRNGVVVAERLADGTATEAELKSARDQADRAAEEAEDVELPHFEKLARLGTSNAVAFALDDGQNAFTIMEWTAYALTGSSAVTDPIEEAKRLATFEAESRGQADVLREIFGNPFRPVELDSAWLSPAVVSLAQHVYDEHAFDQLANLADALIEAGCQDREILQHCRQRDGHVRGCWVVDLILGKD